MPKAIRANQEYFDLLAGDIFARLYTAFPEPIDLYSEIDYDTIDHDEEPERLERLWSATGVWLSQEGFIRYSQQTGDDEHSTFHDAVLTTQGLRALKGVPISLGEATTYGEKLKRAAENIGNEASKKNDQRSHRSHHRRNSENYKLITTSSRSDELSKGC